MEGHPTKRRKRPRRPGPPPASLIALLQKDRAAVQYFESLQAALDNDVQVWKDRAKAAELALEQERKRNSVACTSTAAKKSATKQKARAKSADATEEEGKPCGRTLEDKQEGSNRCLALDADQGEPVDDALFDNISVSSSSSSEDDTKNKNEVALTRKQDLDSSIFGDAFVEESTQIAELVAESLAVFAEYEIFPSSDHKQPDNAEEPQASSSKQRTDQEIVLDLENVLCRSDHAVETQARLFRAVVLFDSFHSRKIVVDHLIERLNPGPWKVWLLLWRNKAKVASETLLLFLATFLESNKALKFSRLLSAFILPDSIASFCLTDGSSSWFESYLKSFLDNACMQCVPEILQVTFGCLKSTVEEDGEQFSNQNDDVGEPDDNLGDLRALEKLESSFDWAASNDVVPAVKNTLSILQKSLANEQTSGITQLLLRIYLIALERESICPVFDPSNEHEWINACYIERFRFLTAVHQNEPVSAFPTLNQAWKSNETGDILRLSKLIECATILGDGHECLEWGRALIDQQYGETTAAGVQSNLLPCLRSARALVFVRVINLEQRKDRLTSFVSQCMREKLVWVKGVTSFNDSTPSEYGMYAYDGRGRLLDACHRLESFINGGATELDKIVASHWVPNNLKPFDRDAPAIERSVRTSPTERSCALSHVSCWRGVQASLTLGSDICENADMVRNPAHILRRFKVSGFASGPALLSKNDAMPPSPVCVILEDDAILIEGFKQKLADLLLDLPRDFHFCSLGYAKPKSAPILPFQGTVGVPSMLWYLTGYCLSASGAEYLLNDLPIIGPVDTWIGLKMAHANWDNSWGLKIGVGAHAQPEVLPERKDFAEIMKFHAYCAIKPLCSQKVRVDTTKTAGSVLAASSTGRNWRRRDTDVEYSGHLVQ